MKIQEFSRRKLLNNQYLAFGREIEAAVEKGNPATLLVEETFTAFQEALQRFDDSIVKVLKSALTDVMVQTDAERDNLFVGLLEQIKTGTRHFDAKKKAAATRLMPLVNTFKGGQARSFDDETGFVNNLLQELASDKHKEDATTLGLTEWAAQLKAANDACAALTSDRSNEKATADASGKTSENRPLLDEAYDALWERFNALAVVNGDANYLSLFTYWNTRIDHYRVAISSRLGAGAGGQSGGGGKPSKPSTGGGSGEKPDDL